MTVKSLPGYEPDPAYSTGIFRRRIRLEGSGDGVLAMLDDQYHAIWVRLSHDGERVTAVRGGFHRWPTTACPGAAAALQGLVGRPLATPLEDLYTSGLPQSSCTHMFDLAVLAMRQACRGPGARTWDVTAPDSLGDTRSASVALDGTVIHEWRLQDDVIVYPPEHAGQYIRRHFLKWALIHFEGDALEGALVLRMGANVARARASIVDDQERPLTNFPQRGVCHAYSSPQVEWAVQRGHTSMDFTDGVIEQPRPAA